MESQKKRRHCLICDVDLSAVSNYRSIYVEKKRIEAETESENVAAIDQHQQESPPIQLTAGSVVDTHVTSHPELDQQQQQQQQQQQSVAQHIHPPLVQEGLEHLSQVYTPTPPPPLVPAPDPNSAAQQQQNAEVASHHFPKLELEAHQRQALHQQMQEAGLVADVFPKEEHHQSEAYTSTGQSVALQQQQQQQQQQQHFQQQQQQQQAQRVSLQPVLTQAPPSTSVASPHGPPPTAPMDTSSLSNPDQYRSAMSHEVVSQQQATPTQHPQPQTSGLEVPPPVTQSGLMDMAPPPYGSQQLTNRNVTVTLEQLQQQQQQLQQQQQQLQQQQQQQQVTSNSQGYPSHTSLANVSLPQSQQQEQTLPDSHSLPPQTIPTHSLNAEALSSQSPHHQQPSIPVSLPDVVATTYTSAANHVQTSISDQLQQESHQAQALHYAGLNTETYSQMAAAWNLQPQVAVTTCGSYTVSSNTYLQTEMALHSLSNQASSIQDQITPQGLPPAQTSAAPAIQQNTAPGLQQSTAPAPSHSQPQTGTTGLPLTTAPAGMPQQITAPDLPSVTAPEASAVTNSLASMQSSASLQVQSHHLTQMQTSQGLLQGSVSVQSTNGQGNMPIHIEPLTEQYLQQTTETVQVLPPVSEPAPEPAPALNMPHQGALLQGEVMTAPMETTPEQPVAEIQNTSSPGQITAPALLESTAPVATKETSHEEVDVNMSVSNHMDVDTVKEKPVEDSTTPPTKEELVGNELKTRLETALQLPLVGRVCHSRYICEQCESRLFEIEHYYKVVSDFRQSFYVTAKTYGVNDSDIADGLSLNPGKVEESNIFSKMLLNAGGSDIGSSLQDLIGQNASNAPVLGGSSSLFRKLMKRNAEQMKKEAGASSKAAKGAVASTPPRRRGRPRKTAQPQKAASAPSVPAPPKLRASRREINRVEPKRRGRKPSKVLRLQTKEPVVYEDDDDTEGPDDDPVVEDPSDDEWKPAGGAGDKPKAGVTTDPKAEPPPPISSSKDDDDDKTEVDEEEEEDGEDDGDEEEEEDAGKSSDADALPAPRKLRTKMYQCLVCNKGFAGVTLLKVHVNKKHKGNKVEEPYKCGTCGDTFETPTRLRIHVKQHLQDGSRTCETCNKSYGSVAALNLHIRNKHPHLRQRTGKFTCTICSKRFSCIQSLQLHTRNQHETEREIHTCSVCKRNFLDKERMQNHESKCENDMKKLGLIRDLTADRSFICKICGASYKNKSAFKQHHYTHKDEKPHQCRMCESKFLYKKSLTDHIASVHKGERRSKAYKCEVCGHGYSHAGDLAKHMTLHSGKFMCPTCNKACAGSYKLKEHMRIHTGEKPYKCDVCNAAFTQAAGLKSHQYTHKANKRFLCNICGMQFAHRTTFRRHGMTHTGERPYVCTICNKGFQFDWVLKDHIKTHTGEKPHLCAICGKSFTQPQHLKTHYRIHTGEKPYRCVHCDVSYRHLSSYNQHKRNCPVTGGNNGDKKEPRAKIRTKVPQMHVPMENPQSMTTISSAAVDILAHLRTSGAYMASTPDDNLVLDQTNNTVMRIPTHHTLQPAPTQPPPLSSPPPHLRVTLPETVTVAAVNSQVGLQSHQQLHNQSSRHLIPLTAAIHHDLAPMHQHQGAVQVTHSSAVGMQPMDMTSTSVMSIAGQGQHDQTVLSFPGTMQNYNQNYVH